MPIEDLVGVISLPVQIPAYGKGKSPTWSHFLCCGMSFTDENLWPAQTTDGQIIEPKMSASFVPDHKASMVLFLDRVYGIDNQDFLLHVLEVGFLPDMRAAASLDTVRCMQTRISACGTLKVGVCEQFVRFGDFR